VDLCFAGIYFKFFFATKSVSSVGRSARNFDTRVFDFVVRVQNFGKPLQKNFRNQKHAKFGAILHDFKKISPEQMKILKIRQVGLHDLLLFLKRLVKNVRWTLVY